MTDTKTWPEIRTDWPSLPGSAADKTTDTTTGTTAGGGDRQPGMRLGGRLGVRLWALLHAPGLLAGRPGGPHDAMVVEDDRSRLAGPRGW